VPCFGFSPHPLLDAELTLPISGIWFTPRSPNLLLVPAIRSLWPSILIVTVSLGPVGYIWLKQHENLSELQGTRGFSETVGLLIV